MSTFVVDASDLERAAAALQRFPSALQSKILTLAAVSGAKVIASEAKAAAPVSTMGRATRGWKASERYLHKRGLLRRSIAVRVVSRSIGTLVLSIKPQNRRAYYWWFVERGTRPHVVRTRKVSLSGRTERNRTVRQHPGARAQPFLFPAAERAEGRARELMQRVLVEAVEALSREMSGGR